MPIRQIQDGCYTTLFTGTKTNVPTGTSSPRGTANETGASTQFGYITRPNSSAASVEAIFTWVHDNGYVIRMEKYNATMNAYSNWSYCLSRMDTEHQYAQTSYNSGHDTMNQGTMTISNNSNVSWRFFCQTGGVGAGVPAVATLYYNLKVLSKFPPTWTAV